ncbi:MAG TPA: sigma factor-like helix-turn-helix DNA-binding protein, partial [Solirubrobacteraceae bacterium]|nr:sigma factor-like helix-turn-helix DNA-binding protein [Solirubrobacteraceae bacterium]
MAMHLYELGLTPATQTCLHNADIRTIEGLLEHSCRELLWHSEIGAEALYDIICKLNQHGFMLPPTPQRTIRRPNERNREAFRLRVVEGRSLADTGKHLGISPERVRQVLTF